MRSSVSAVSAVSADALGSSASGVRSALRLWLLAALPLLAGCGPRLAGPLSAPSPAEECRWAPPVADGERRAAARAAGDRTVEVGLTRPVDPRSAPVPRNPDEAFLFRLLYEPLLRVDCTGRRYPALASEWSSADDGRRWTFTIRDDALFWNGDPVTADAVAASWRRAEREGRRPWRGERPRRVLVEGERRLTVGFAAGRRAAPAVLADPGLSVVREGVSEEWPVMGTGAYRPVEGSVTRSSTGPARPRGEDGTVVFLALEADGGSGAHPERLHVRVSPDEDPRELLDAGADLVLTTDRQALAYARGRPDLVVRALPWDRTYVLALPRTASSPSSGPSLPLDFLDALARDAVGSDARPARDPVAPSGGGLCSDRAGRPEARPAASPPADRPRRPPVRRIAHLRDDATGRELAERLVALAGPRRVEATGAARTVLADLGLGAGATAAVATALDPEDLPAPLRAGSGRADASASFRPAGELAFVVGLPRRVPGACPDLGPANRARDAEGFPYLLVPLVDTRRAAILRAPGVPLAADADGTPHLFPGTER